MACHDWNLEAEADAQAGEGLVADPDRARGCRGEGVDHAATDRCEDGSDDDEGGKVAQVCDTDARGNDCDGYRDRMCQCESLMGDRRGKRNILSAMMSARLRIPLSVAEVFRTA